MQAATLLVRGFRNLADRTLELPAAGMALVGPNGHGKTNLLEALAYPVLFRSLRGARDRDVARFGGPGFHVEVTRSDGVAIATTWRPESKQVTVDGTERERIADALGAWLAVAFLPTDRGIVQGGAAERRRWLDRMLSLARPTYLEALMRYRAALVRRNAALRKGDAVSAAAFDPQLARAGAAVVAERLDWAGGAGSGWRNELAELGEALDVTLEYRGDAALADPDQWAERLAKSAPRDRARGQTHVGPHRDDLTLGLAGKSLREFGSTGQQRTAAIALRLLEHATLTASSGNRPALLVDDVFAELDAERQARLARRLGALGAQLVVTAPREADLPDTLETARWHVADGNVISD